MSTEAIRKKKVSLALAYRAELKKRLAFETDKTRIKQINAAIAKIDKADAKAFPWLMLLTLIPQLIELFKKLFPSG